MNLEPKLESKALYVDYLVYENTESQLGQVAFVSYEKLAKGALGWIMLTKDTKP